MNCVCPWNQKWPYYDPRECERFWPSYLLPTKVRRSVHLAKSASRKVIEAREPK